VRRLLLGLVFCVSCSAHHPPSDEWKDCVPGESFSACEALGKSYIQVGSLRRVNADMAGVVPNVKSSTDTEWYVAYSIEARPDHFQDVVAMLDQALGPHRLGRINEIALDAQMSWKTTHGFWTAESLTSEIRYLALVRVSGQWTNEQIDRSVAQHHEEAALWSRICAYLASH